MAVEQILDGACIHPVFIHQVQQHAGIQRTAPGAHHQPFQRGEAHRAGHAAPVLHRAQAGAVAEMTDDQARTRQRRIDLPQPGDDEFVGQAMKPVTPNAGIGNAFGQRECLG